MGIFGGLKSFFGGKTTTTSQTLDPQSQSYVDWQRRQAQGAANTATAGPQGGGSWFMGPQSMSINEQVSPFFNPYQQHVLGAVGQQYDHLRDQAMTQTSADATRGGAYGGSRAAVLAGARLGELDRAQGQTMADLTYSGYNNALGMGTQYAEQQRQLAEQQRMEPLWRQQQALGFSNLGMGPVGMTQTQKTSGGGFGDLLKTGAGLFSLYAGAGGKMPFGGGGGYGGGGYGGGPGMRPGTQIPMGNWDHS